MNATTDAQLWAQFTAAVLSGSTGSEYGGAMSEQAHALYAGRVADYALAEFRRRGFLEDKTLSQVQEELRYWKRVAQEGRGAPAREVEEEEMREVREWKQPNINPPPTYQKPPPPPPPSRIVREDRKPPAAPPPERGY